MAANSLAQLAFFNGLLTGARGQACRLRQPDRFHIVQQMSKALDKVRAAEVKQLKADGFRTQEAYETALYQNLGALPMPEFTHEFC